MLAPVSLVSYDDDDDAEFTGEAVCLKITTLIYTRTITDAVTGVAPINTDRGGGVKNSKQIGIPLLVLYLSKMPRSTNMVLHTFTLNIQKFCSPITP